MNQTYLIDHPSIFRRKYVVSGQQGIIATMEFHRLSNTKATAEFNGKQWVLENNFLGNKVSFAPADSPDSPSLKINSNLINSKASVEIGGGEYQFKMVPLTKIRQSFVWLDSTGKEVVRFNKRSILKLKFQVVVSQSSISGEDLNTLVVLGFYLIKSKYPGPGTSGSY